MRRAAVIAALLGLAGCGGDDDFENRPRPPVPLQLTGVITESRVTVSPDKVGAGPVVITVSNQTDESRTLTLEGGPRNIQERVGPINPLDTATIQKTLEQGSYTVKVGSERAVAREIRPAALKIGKPRKSASDRVLLP